MNFGEVLRVQLAEPTLLTSTLGPLGPFCSDAKERVVCGKQREATVHDLSLGSCACCEGPAFGQNSLVLMMMMMALLTVFRDLY